MSGPDDTIARISALVGIGDRYQDAFGRTVETPPETKTALLEGFGLALGDPEAARDSLERVTALKQGLVPSLIPLDIGRPVRVPVRAAAAETAAWRLTDEGGRVREGRDVLRRGGANAWLDLPPLRPTTGSGSRPARAARKASSSRPLASASRARPCGTTPASGA
jgi:(1->4)-alpha-D-glucan 1-alpha-D-glucosylmutase